MVVLERKLKGVLPYRVVFFPTEAMVRQMTENLDLTWMARLFSTDVAVGAARQVVRHDIAATTRIDLTQDLDTPA
jgi:hypothetical protein